MNNWVSVFISKDKIRAEQVKNKLISRGINAVIIDKIDGRIPVLGTAEINVPENQSEDAKRYIEEIHLDDTQA